MVKVKRDPTVRRDVVLSIGEKIIHNSFYLPRYKTRSKLYRGYDTYEGFGYGLADRAKGATKSQQPLDKARGC